jgi:hypothetical protein
MMNMVSALALIIRLYDTGAGVSPRDLQKAQGVAAAVLQQAGVAAEWLVCPRTRQAHAGPLATGCANTPRESELMVRLVNGRDGNSATLGYANVDTTAGAGRLATVFTDRVGRLADEAGIDRHSLLGWAIAHEIGHLLFGTTAHEAHGLMRARWSVDEIRRRRSVDWRFSALDEARLRARMLKSFPFDPYRTFSSVSPPAP